MIGTRGLGMTVAPICCVRTNSIPRSDGEQEATAVSSYTLARLDCRSRQTVCLFPSATKEARPGDIARFCERTRESLLARSREGRAVAIGQAVRRQRVAFSVMVSALSLGSAIHG